MYVCVLFIDVWTPLVYCSSSECLEELIGASCPDVTSESGGWPHGIRGVQVQTLKASRVIACLLLLTYLRVSTRCLTVSPALRLSSLFWTNMTLQMWPRIECHGCLERCYCFLRDLSMRHLEINVKSINCSLKEQNISLYCDVRCYLQLPFVSVLSLYLCMCA